MASAGGAIAAEADAVDAAGGSHAAPTQLDAMLVTGTRASNRTQFETLAPVDVFTKEDITSVESTDLKDVLAQLVPSFVVQRLPMADGQVFVRPATLRGLSPDQTLVLVNGRRFHRSALLGNRGAQAADLAQIPTSAIKRIEVLRDGASAQYGSDAIAGVINIILEDGPGTEITAGYSQYAQGDGASRDFSARTGWSLGDYGSLVLFAESSNSDATSRTRQRPDAIAFQSAHPELDVPNPVQRWGQPELESRRVGFNVKADASETLELYALGLYSHSDGVSDFNWRNPDTTTGAYRTTAIFPGWNLRSLYPVGFSPQYGNVQNDLQLVGGLRGEIHAEAALGCKRLVWPQCHRLQPEEFDQRLAGSRQPDRVRSRPPDPDREERQRRLQLRMGRGRAVQADQRCLWWRVPPGDLPGACR